MKFKISIRNEIYCCSKKWTPAFRFPLGVTETNFKMLEMNLAGRFIFVEKDIRYNKMTKAFDQWFVEVILYTLHINRMMFTLIKWRRLGLNRNITDSHYLQGTIASMITWKIVDMITYVSINIHLFSINVDENWSFFTNFPQLIGSITIFVCFLKIAL